MIIALGVLSRSCSVRLDRQGIPAAVRTLLRINRAASASLLSGPTNAVTPESCAVPAVFPAASTTIALIWDGTLSHPADFSTASRVRRSANGSGSANTEKPKFCPANSFSAAMILSWSSGAMVLVPWIFDYYTKLGFSPAHKIHKIHALRMVSASSALSSLF